MRKTKMLFLLLMFLLIAGAGCSLTGSKTAQPDGGIFKSADKGETWTLRSEVYSVNGLRRNFSQVGVRTIVMDPQDRNALYAGTMGNGIFFTYDGGNGWMQPPQIVAGDIRTIAVDPQNKCTIYASLGNQILQTNDCNRSYAALYQDTRPEALITKIVVDPVNSSIVYAGNSTGDLLKSTDKGKSWLVVGRFLDPVAQIIINPLSPSVLFVASQNKGIYRTPDRGVSWEDLNTGLKQFGGAYVYRSLVLMDPKTESLLLASQYGLTVSNDGGKTWKALTLLTPPNGADIRAATANPQNLKEIFYSTPSTFYKSTDGGVKWVTKKNLSTRAPTVLLADPADPKTMYMGYVAPPPQKGLLF